LVVVVVVHICACSRAEEAAAGSDCKVSRIYGAAGIIKLLAGESPKFLEPPRTILFFCSHFSCVLLSVHVISSNALWSGFSWHVVLPILQGINTERLNIYHFSYKWY
jgi:hypothetical protein